MIGFRRVRMSRAGFRLLSISGICLLLWSGLLIVTSSSTSRAASALAPNAAPCPAWAIDTTPNDGTLGNVLTAVSAVSTNEVWAVGYTVIERTGLDSFYKNLVMRWDGASWKVVPSPNPGTPTNYMNSVVAFSDKDVWVSGTSGRADNPQPFLLHWDGQQWTTAPLPPLDPSGNELYALSGTGPTDIWAVGSIGCAKCKTEHSLVLHYNGVDWQAVYVNAGAFADALFAVSALSATEVWFSGYQFNDFGAQPLAFRWNGSGLEKTEFPRMPAGRRGILYGVAAISSGNVWAAGYSVTTSGPNVYNHALIYQYNGAGWFNNEAQIPTISEEGSVLTAISASAANNVWAVGYFIASGVPRALVMRYDGANWTLADAPNPGVRSAFYGASVVPNGDLFIGGYQVADGEGMPATTLVERYADACAAPPTVAPTPTVPQSTPTSVPVVPIPGANTRTFPETGKTVGGIFLDYWDQNGGLAQQGFPISNVIGEVSPLDRKAYTVQYFERAVFEYHPENQPPFNVLLSQLGTFRYAKKYPNGAPGQTPNTSAGSAHFPETGKRVGGRFLQYWQENGGLAQQGFPISDEFQEVSDLDGKTYTVQYFERAVFESHPENQPPYDVLLSQLGTFRYKEQYQGQIEQSPPPAASTSTSVPGAGATPTSVAGGPCDGIPAGDPELIYESGQCIPKGYVLRIRVDVISGETASVAVYGPDSETLHGQPFNVHATGSLGIAISTVDGYEPGLYKLVIDGLSSHRHLTGYFRALP